jgi:hypothetical protein
VCIVVVTTRRVHTAIIEIRCIGFYIGISIGMTEGIYILITVLIDMEVGKPLLMTGINWSV